MGPNRVNGNQADINFRLIELYNALGYNLPDLPSSVEGIYKVHPAKSVPVCPGSLEFTNLTHSCLVPGKIQLFSIIFY